MTGSYDKSSYHISTTIYGASCTLQGSNYNSKSIRYLLNDDCNTHVSSICLLLNISFSISLHDSRREREKSIETSGLDLRL